jgi:hypothetical protein
MAEKREFPHGYLINEASKIDVGYTNKVEVARDATIRAPVRPTGADGGQFETYTGLYQTYHVDQREQLIDTIIEETTPLIQHTESEVDELRAAAALNLLDYTKYTFPQYIVDDFHRDVSGHLTNMVMGRPGYERLMLFAPPQHGKSELVSTRLPSFWLAHNPDLPVALVSYGGKLAERNSRNAREVLRDPRFAEITFPDSTLTPDMDNWRVYDWHINGGRGYTLAVGVGGAITGHGFGLIIVDDPIENWAAAQSELIRESTWHWWLGTLKTRLWEGGNIVLMMAPSKRAGCGGFYRTPLSRCDRLPLRSGIAPIQNFASPLTRLAGKSDNLWHLRDFQSTIWSNSGRPSAGWYGTQNTSRCRPTPRASSSR